MSRFYTYTSLEYCWTANNITNYPLTMATWFYPASVTLTMAMMGRGNTGVNESYDMLYLSGTAAGDPIRVYSKASGAAAAFATATVGVNGVANQWYHACGVIAGSQDRRCYFNGGNKGTETATDRTPYSVSGYALGAVPRLSFAFPWYGGLAESAVWNVALTDDEVAALGAGVCPLFIRPGSLVSYWPLGGMYDTDDGDHDMVGGYHLTPVNTPTTMDHPGGIIYPTAPLVGAPPPPAPVTPNPLSVLRPRVVCPAPYHETWNIW